MSNSSEYKDFLTADQAAKILRVTSRQVHHYGTNGRIRTARAGRRVLFHPGDVEDLAQELRVDIRPLPVRRDDVVEQLAKYVQERSDHDQLFLAAQRDTAQRLDAIEQRLQQPPPPAPKPPRILYVIAGLLALVTILVVVVLILQIV